MNFRLWNNYFEFELTKSLDSNCRTVCEPQFFGPKILLSKTAHRWPYRQSDSLRVNRLPVDSANIVISLNLEANGCFIVRGGGFEELTLEIRISNQNCEISKTPYSIHRSANNHPRRCRFCAVNHRRRSVRACLPNGHCSTQLEKNSRLIVWEWFARGSRKFNKVQ